MRIAILLGLFVIAVASTSALRCWTCENQRSLSACSRNGYLKRCQSSQGACETVVRRNGNQFSYFKHCKQRQACVNNQLQNFGRTSTPRKCSGTGRNSVCFCCCYRDGCGRNTNDCTEPARPVTTTRALPTTTTTTTLAPELFCELAPILDNADVECEGSNPDGTFPLGTECQIYCNEGSTQDDEGKNYTTCQAANPDDPSSTETVWLPPVTECRADELPRCMTPPLWEEGFGPTGIVDCGEELSSGGWPLHSTCRYICPEEHFLVGSEFATCIITTHPETSQLVPVFYPTHPCCEPPCNPLPADYLFVLDQSQSIGRENFSRVINFVTEAMWFLQFNPAINIGLISFSTRIVNQIPFAENNDELQELVQNIIQFEDLPKGTFTVNALDFVSTEAFTPSFNDRPDVPDYVIIITDGMSNPSGSGESTRLLTDAASDLHDQTAVVFAFGINASEDNEELNTIATEPYFVRSLDSEGGVYDAMYLLESQTAIACDPICNFEHTDIPLV